MQKEFLSPDDVMQILDIGRDTALAIMSQLPHVLCGGIGSKRPRKRVRNEVFYGWLTQQDGYIPGAVPLRAVKGGKAR